MPDHSATQPHSDMEEGRGRMSRTSSFSSAFESVSELFPAMSITRSVWRKPQEHDDGGGGKDGSQAKALRHRHEEWYELFYDLIFVSAAIQMGNLLKYHISYTNVFTTTLLFMIMRATWDHLTMYQNSYDTKDLVHHVFYMVESMTAFVMCLSLGMKEHDHEWDKSSYMAPFAVAAAAGRLAQTLMYSQIMAQRSKHVLYLKVLAVAQRVSALLFIASAIWGNNGYTYAYFWIASFIVERPLVNLFVVLFLPTGESAIYRVPQHTSHLIHRQVRAH